MKLVCYLKKRVVIFVIGGAVFYVLKTLNIFFRRPCLVGVIVFVDNGSGISN